MSSVVRVVKMIAGEQGPAGAFLTPQPLDPATIAWITRVTQQSGGLVSPQRASIIDALEVGLKNKGLFSKFDGVWIYAGENVPSGLTDITNQRITIQSGTPTFTTNLGFNGQDSATPAVGLDTQLDLSLGGFQFTQNSAHVSIWSTTNITPVNGGAALGFEVAGYNTSMYMNTDSHISGRINDNPVSGEQAIPATRMGHWLINRPSSTLSAIYQNGSKFADVNETSGALVAGMHLFSLCSFNATSTTRINGNPNQFAMMSIGAALTDQNILDFYNLLRSCMNSIGVP